MRRKKIFTIAGSAVIAIIFSSCATPLHWPESPLYEAPEYDANWNQPQNAEAAKRAIAGHYAHFDVVAYEDLTTRTPMRTFIISYGFTDFYLEDGNLFQSDTFVHAEQKLSQKNVESYFRDEAVQSIKPRVEQVELSYANGRWQIYRPPSPTLMGITGDPSLPLSRNPNDPNIIDPDEDGKPGVTVEIVIGKLMKGEIYIIRREIYSYYLTLNSDGILYGHVVDSSEQFVIDASLKVLAQESNQYQHPDFGLSPIMLVPVSDDIDTPEELMAIRDQLFPQEPELVEN